MGYWYIKKSVLSSFSMLSNINISVLTKNASQEAFSLACEVFVDASVLHKAMDVSLAEYRIYMQSAFEEMRQQNLSLVAIDTRTGKIVGCLMACDYMKQPKCDALVPDSLRPINSLLGSLDDMYRRSMQFPIGEYMLVDMAVVTPSARGQGIYRKLREAIHGVGRAAGFLTVVGELSSAATQHLCINVFNHKVCAEISYSSYDYKGSTPFSNIESPETIVLAEGRL